MKAIQKLEHLLNSFLVEIRESRKGFCFLKLTDNIEIFANLYYSEITLKIGSGFEINKNLFISDKEEKESEE